MRVLLVTGSGGVGNTGSTTVAAATALRDGCLEVDFGALGR